MPTMRTEPSETRESLALEPAPLSAVEHDMRRKRPPLLSFLLRWETLRRVARVASLVALDVTGVFLAIFTALALKAAVRDAFVFDQVVEQTKDYVAFAFLLTALLFAQSGLYSSRAQRPGLSRIVSSLTAVTVVALLYAVINGEEFSSYYIFYGTLFFAVAFVASLRFLYELVSGAMLRAAGYRRRAVLVGRDDHIEAVAHALQDGQSPVNVIGFVSMAPRPDNGLVSLGRLADIAEVVGT